MLNWNKMKNISGYIFSMMLLLLLTNTVTGQDTLRTYGPRFGLDLSRFAYLLATPVETGAEVSADVELYKNIYPVFELGYNRISEEGDLFDYTAGGTYARLGIDYNLLPVTDRSEHHTISVGIRYAISRLTHSVEGAVIANEYWGDRMLDSYENSVTGNWFELVGGLKTELVPNLFLGWLVRYKILLNPEMDPLVTPQLIPGYGKGTSERGFGITYSILYKIPLIKR